MLLNPIIKKYNKSGDIAQLQPRDDMAQFSIEGLAPSSFPLIIASLYEEVNDHLVIITENSQKLNDLYIDLSCYLNQDLLYPLPPWETLPYENVSPSEKIERERITTLYKIINNSPGIVITCVEALIRKVPAKDFLIQKGFLLNVNDEVPFDDLVDMLVTYGYSRESKIEAFGQFALKGGIIDIYLPNHDNPVRLDFFGDTLESIRIFDPVTQISQESLDNITLYPRKEIVLFNKEQKLLLELLQKAEKKGLDFPETLHTQITDNNVHDVPGIEDLFTLVMDSTDLSTYFDNNYHTVMIDTPQLISKKNNLAETYDKLYKKNRGTTLCVEPEDLLEPACFDRLLEDSLKLQTYTITQHALQWKLKSIQNFQGKIKLVREQISEWQEQGWKIIITTGFEGQARRLFDLLSEYAPDDDFESVNPDSDLNIVIIPLSQGVMIYDIKTIILTDHEIFGKSYRKKKKFKSNKSRPIETFLELKTGDYVVHINHGIGTFAGIERMSAGGVERDFLLIEYAGEDKLYVSLDQITMVQKYIGFDGKKPRIDFLGKKSAWNKIKEKVKQSVEEIAQELIKIYSKRNAQKGYQYPPDTLWQEEFESQFEYEETPDQITAIEDVKDDMEHPRPMDRLICGDVGFGKTEVAIRAAFKAVMAGKQVAVLVPTTVLAMQHFSSFKKRFTEYPIEVGIMSRFKTAAENKRTKQRLLEGEIDIIIGTHALTAKDVKIKNLGLLVIDEEQRFGVKHKERLKELRALVDVLTLSATPIPRTLHMSLTGIRDLSIIQTPPENRQSIETYVMEENADILRMAILNEIERNGQAYFVHNRVQTIDAQLIMLEKLVPEASFCVAHGQMGEHELEEIMIEFLNGKYDVLISTTIIESGIDIPNVNTMLINRAETFGLSQLYQLKGRVGRSNRKAYAYLFYPKHSSLTEEAQKRLQVIAEYSELGSGFKIAMKDMEIRGAGNIIGKEQSGSIMEVGFELYTQMLDDAVSQLKGEKITAYFRTPIFMKADFFIPDDYINDEKQKIEFYKRFESCNTIEEVDELEKELIDRFGKPPHEVMVLIDLERIRTVASSLFIDEILEDSKSIRITISSDTKIDAAKLVNIIAEDNRLSIDPKNSEILIFKPNNNDKEKKFTELKKLLQHIS